MTPTSRVLAVVLLTLGSAAGAAQAADGRSAAVYFLGVDHLSPAAEGARLAVMLGGDAEDRWALTERFVDIADQAGIEGVALDVRLDRWQPESDPYNFGLVTVRGANHGTKVWRGSSAITYVAVDLTWLQIGNDERTRMQVQKAPELRYSVSRYYVREFAAPEPPRPDELPRLYERTFSEAVHSLLAEVSRRNLRAVERSAAQMRYVSVEPPIVLPRMLGDLTELYSQAKAEALAKRMSLAAAAYMEDRLLAAFAEDERFDTVALVPNREAQRYLRAEWAAFARRIDALSGLNANRAATGRTPPQLLELVPVCSERGASGRHGLEIRSNLVELPLTLVEADAFNDYVRLGLRLVADVKLPLTESASLSLLGDPEPVHYTHRPSDFAKPESLTLAEYFGDYAIGGIVADAFERLMPDVIVRLAENLAQAGDLRNPKFRESCNETDV